MAAAIDWRVRLRDQEILLFVAGQIFDLVRNATVVNFAIRGLNEAKLIDSREGRHRTDQTNVRTFRCLDGTNATVMRWMNIAHFESRAIAREAAWSQR